METKIYSDKEKIKKQLSFFPLNLLLGEKFLQRPSGIFRTKKSRKKISDIVKSMPQSSIWLNIGSGSTNYGKNFLNIDISVFQNVTLVGDAHFLPVKPESVDGVVIQGVCEHIHKPEMVVNEIFRVLKRSGIVIAEIPFIQGFHADPLDFQRYTVQGLEDLFVSFEKIDVGVAVGPASGFVWIFREFLAIIFSFNNYYLYKFFRYIFSWLTAPISYLDFFLERNKFAVVIASSLYFVGRKIKGVII